MVEDLRKSAADAFVTIGYSFTGQAGEMEIEDEGVVEAQDDMWHLKGRNIEIYTSEGATWILDPDSREALVEPAWTYEDLVRFYSSVSESGKGPEIKIISRALSEKKPMAYFTPVLDDGWVVTDLR